MKRSWNIITKLQLQLSVAAEKLEQVKRITGTNGTREELFAFCRQCVINTLSPTRMRSRGSHAPVHKTANLKELCEKILEWHQNPELKNQLEVAAEKLEKVKRLTGTKGTVRELLPFCRQHGIPTNSPTRVVASGKRAGQPVVANQKELIEKILDWAKDNDECE